MMDREAYRKFCLKYPDKIPVFYAPEYLDVVCGPDHWSAVWCLDKQGDLQGIWPYFTTKRFGHSFLLNPKLTPSFGPILFYPQNLTKTESILTFEKKILSGLSDQLPKTNILKLKCAPDLKNHLPLHWKGWKQTTQYTYRINLRNFNQVSLEDNYSSALRADLRNVPSDVDVFSSNEVDILFELASNSYKMQGTPIYFSLDFLKKIDAVLGEDRLLLIARVAGTPVGAVYIIYSHETAFLLMIGRTETGKEYAGVTKRLIHEAICTSAARCKVFDFEGSMFPQFEKVFRSYGARQTPYHVLSRIPSKWMKYMLTVKDML